MADAAASSGGGAGASGAGAAAATPSTPREQLRQWFDAIDKDCDGRLTAPELQAALQLGGLNFSLATVAHIIR